MEMLKLSSAQKRQKNLTLQAQQSPRPEPTPCLFLPDESKPKGNALHSPTGAVSQECREQLFSDLFTYILSPVDCATYFLQYQFRLQRKSQENIFSSLFQVLFSIPVSGAGQNYFPSLELHGKVFHLKLTQSQGASHCASLSLLLLSDQNMMRQDLHGL